jgi:hypothetical protein
MNHWKIKRQRWKRGAVVRIRLDKEHFAYGQMLDPPEYAFFNVHDSSDRDAESVAVQPVIFRLWVMTQAHSCGRWEKIGTAPLQRQLEERVPRFNQDPLDLSTIRLGDDGTNGKLVTTQECEQYERAAVWDAHQVEDRLRDYFAGRPNVWVESLRPKSTNRPKSG